MVRGRSNWGGPLLLHVGSDTMTTLSTSALSELAGVFDKIDFGRVVPDVIAVMIIRWLVASYRTSQRSKG
jgi:hypothetical protein